MDWIGLACNFAAILFGLLLYIIVTNTKWGKKHEQYQYFIMLVVVIIACLFGWGLRTLVNMYIA